MTENSSKIWHFKTNRHLFSAMTILVAITFFEYGSIYFQFLYREHPMHTKALDNIWLASQLVGATLLGAYSDRYKTIPWRKPIFIFGFFIFVLTIFSLNLMNIKSFYVLIACITLNGILGSYLGVARAFFFDMCHKKRLQHFVITILFQGLAWASLGYMLKKSMIQYTKLGTILSLFAPILFLLLFFTKNEQPHTLESAHQKQEVQNLRKKFLSSFFICILAMYFIQSFIYQIMPYYGEFSLSTSSFNYEIYLLGAGGLIGPLITLFLRKLPNIEWVKITTLVFTLISLIFAFKVIFRGYPDILSKEQFFIYSIAVTMLWPLLTNEFLLRTTFSEDGFVMGFLESWNSLAELCAAVLVSFPIISKYLSSNITYAIIFAILLVLIFSANAFRKRSLK